VPTTLELAPDTVTTTPDRSYVVLISGVAALGGFLFGFDSGVINGTVTALAAAFGSSAVGTGFSVASMSLGCAVGALCAGPAADRYGRKPMMLITALLFALSAWGSGIAVSATEFITYRLVGGIGVGAASVLAPAYISEIAPAPIRGRLASLQQVAIVTGIFAALMSNYQLAAISGGAEAPLWMGLEAFRWMFWVELLPAVALAVGALLIPESPRFLVSAKREQDAEAVFAKTGADDPAELVRAVRDSLSVSHRPRIGDLLQNGRVRPIVWVGVALSVFQQFVGINVVFYYGEVLWRSVGFAEEQALLINVVTGAVCIVSALVAIAFIDRIGRRPLLLMGSAGMTFFLIVVALAFSTATVTESGPQLSGVAGPVALLAANLFVFCFGASWGPCVWVLLGEMFQNQFRGAALSAGAGAQWIANFTVSMTFPVMLGSLGASLTYCVYAGFAALSLVFVIRFVRETKGRALEQM